jgi:Zn-dependent alcohol dehydrogenase
MYFYPHYQAMEGAKMAGASRIIGVDLNPAKFEQGTIFLTETLGCPSR